MLLFLKYNIIGLITSSMKCFLHRDHGDVRRSKKKSYTIVAWTFSSWGVQNVTFFVILCVNKFTFYCHCNCDNQCVGISAAILTATWLNTCDNAHNYMLNVFAVLFCIMDVTGIKCIVCYIIVNAFFLQLYNVCLFYLCVSSSAPLCVTLVCSTYGSSTWTLTEECHF